MTWSSLGGVVDHACTVAWTAGCRLSALGGTFPRRWWSSGGSRILVIAPHPDDEVAGCGGVMLLHRAAGDDVTVLHVTDGRGSRALGLGANAMAVRRRAEAAASVGIAGVSRWEWMGLPEGGWADADLARPLATFLRVMAPQVIYAPSRVDFHPEHLRVARVLAGSSFLVEQPQIVMRIYQVQVPLTGILVNLVAPMSAVLSRARRACDAYSSQAESLRAPFRLKSYAGVVHGLGTAAEEFWEISAGAYARVHGQESPELKVEHFRGLRRLSMTDPLAFVEGRTERLRLRSLSG